MVYPDSVAPGHDEYSSDWNLDNIRRHDVSQADVAALMAYLIGVELPLSYLAASIKEKAEASLVNAQDILEIYNFKERIKKAAQLRYVPYKPLSAENHTPNERIQKIRTLIDKESFEEAIEETAVLTKIALEGLRYHQTYDWLFLQAQITIGYLGWIAFALTTVIDLHILQGTTQPKRSLCWTVLFSSALAAMYAFFIASRSPLMYYAYAFFPVVFWEEVFARRETLVKGRQALFGHIQSGKDVLSLVLRSIIHLGIVESLVKRPICVRCH